MRPRSHYLADQPRLHVAISRFQEEHKRKWRGFEKLRPKTGPLALPLLSVVQSKSHGRSQFKTQETDSPFHSSPKELSPFLQFTIIDGCIFVTLRYFVFVFRHTVNFCMLVLAARDNSDQKKDPLF